jgi:hypothetical protein
MMLHKLRNALAALILALAALSTVDSASAQSRRIPDTASLLATYRVTTDDASDVASYERVTRFNRFSANRIVREDGLAAVVSDAPESLRVKRRDLQAPQASSRGAPNPGAGGMGGGFSRGGMNPRGMGSRR